MAEKKSEAAGISMDDEIGKKIEAAIEEYGALGEGEHTLKLGSGVRVELHPLPPLLLERLERQFPEPEPPMVEVEVHGKKEMQPNPDDPDYLKALQETGRKKGRAYMDLALLKGIEVELPKDDSWLEELELSGIEIGETKAAKKLAYIQCVLITSIDDLVEVTSRVLAMSGVTPQAVDEATKTVSG